MAATANTRIGGMGRRGPQTFGAAAAPTVDNDATAGHQVGDQWLVTTGGAERLFACFDTAEGAAVWKEVTLVA